MTAKITISTTDDKANLLTYLSKELGIKKKDVFEKALSYYADMVEVTVVNTRLKDIQSDNAQIITLDEFDKVTQ